MEYKGVSEAWPLQRLIKMIQVTHNKDNELWKQSTPLSSIDQMKDAGKQDRDKIATWVLKLNTHFRFHHETFFLTATILDRFMSSVKVQPKYLKCIAVSCLYLASKITEEEDMIPRTGELVKESKCGCRVCDVVRMERIILEKLSWSIQSPTALDYLHLFQALAFGHLTELNSSLSLPRRMHMLAGALAKLLCDSETAKLPNAALSLALVSIELEALSSEPTKWMRVTGQLQLLSKVTTDDMMTCREHLLCRLPGKKSKIYDLLPSSSINISLSSCPQLPNTKKHNHVHALSTGGNSGATKRKAAPPPLAKINELSKKPHPESAPLTAIANDEHASSAEAASCVRRPSLCRRLTYAEIVKFGINGDLESKLEGGVLLASDASSSKNDVARRCGFEANSSFLSPLSPNYSGQASIKA